VRLAPVFQESGSLVDELAGRGVLSPLSNRSMRIHLGAGPPPTCTSLTAVTLSDPFGHIETNGSEPLGYHAIVVLPHHGCTPGGAEASTQRWITTEFDQPARKADGVSRGNEVALDPIVERLSQPTHVGGHDRSFHGHGLEHSVWRAIY